jgi:hypothetical protein
MSKTRNSLTLNAVANVVTGRFVFFIKPQREFRNFRFMQVKATLSKKTKTEILLILNVRYQITFIKLTTSNICCR